MGSVKRHCIGTDASVKVALIPILQMRKVRPRLSNWFGTQLPSHRNLLRPVPTHPWVPVLVRRTSLVYAYLILTIIHYVVIASI